MDNLSIYGLFENMAVQTKRKGVCLNWSRQVKLLGNDGVDFVVKFALELPLKWVYSDYNTE